MRSTARTPLAAKWRAFQDAFLQSSASEQIKGIRAGIPASHLRGLAETLNIPQSTVFRLVGLSPSAARRLIALNRNLTPTASERLLNIGTIEKHAVAVFGTTDLAHAWLLTSNIALGDVSPLSLLDTGLGTQEVARILNAIEHSSVA